MSHPLPGHDYSEPTYESHSPHKEGSRPKLRRKMTSSVHSMPEFAELRKGNQGINSKGSIDKSKRRHEKKNLARTKALEAKAQERGEAASDFSRGN